MTSKTLFQNSEQIPFSLLRFEQQEMFDKHDVKRATKALHEAYKEGLISSELFKKLIGFLLLSFMQKDFEDKFESKTEHLEQKLHQIFSL